MNDTITVPVHLGREDFFKFSMFDAFIRRKHWRPPVLFAAILLVSAALCLLKDGVLLTVILSAVALGLPAVYVGSYVLSILSQCKKAGLKSFPLVYTVTLTPKDILVTTDTEQAHFRYDKLHAVYRRGACIYLYVHPVKAFLLPAADIEGGTNVVWDFLEGRVPAEKRHDRKK